MRDVLGTTRIPTDALNRLPASVADNRILKTDETAALTGYSIPHWREMYRDGRAPAPIRLSTRRYGWKLSTILAWLDEKAAASQRADG